MILEDGSENYGAYVDHAHSNELEIIGSKKCGCLFCGSSFSARKVKSWVKDGPELSAICPHCGMMGIVGDASGLPVEGKEFAKVCDYHNDSLTDLDRRYGKIAFCQLFSEGSLEDNEANEKLYERYLLEIFEDAQDAATCLALARLYAQGLRYIPADLDLAMDYYRDPSLLTDHGALYELGLLYEARMEKGDARKAYECYAKSAALGSLPGSSRLAICYLQGTYVKMDEEFGLNALLSIFGELLSKAFTSPQYLREFMHDAHCLALCFYTGHGTKPNDFRATRYFLIASLAERRLRETEGEGNDVIRHSADRCLHALMDKNKDKTIGPMVFDEDTFFDSFYEQYDTLSQKAITHVGLSDDGETLLLGIAANQPMLIVDAGNFKADILSDTEWAIYHATFEAHPDETRFERIEFVSLEEVDFIHDDPTLGEIRVLRIHFEPRKPEEEGAAE